MDGFHEGDPCPGQFKSNEKWQTEYLSSYI